LRPTRRKGAQAHSRLGVDPSSSLAYLGRVRRPRANPNRGSGRTRRESDSQHGGIILLCRYRPVKAVARRARTWASPSYFTALADSPIPTSECSQVCYVFPQFRPSMPGDLDFWQSTRLPRHGGGGTPMARGCVACPIAGEMPTTRADLRSDLVSLYVHRSACFGLILPDAVED
jgi:hypothetical protein